MCRVIQGQYDSLGLSVLRSAKVKAKKISQKSLDANIVEFEKAVRYFGVYFGLVDWELHVFEKETENRAEVIWNTIGRIASVFYGKEWIRKVDLTMEEIVKVAFHEIAELLQHDNYDNLGKHRGWEFAQEKSHVIIRFLENKLFPIAYKEYLGE